MSNPAFDILQRLVLEISDPKIPNAEAAVRAVRDALAAYPMIKEGLDAVQEPSPTPKVRGPGRPKKDEAGSAPGVGKSDGGQEVAGESIPENLQRKSTKSTFGHLRGSGS